MAITGEKKKQIAVLTGGGDAPGLNAVIRGIVVKAKKLGYDVQVIIDIRISKGKLFLVEKKIASHPNICAIYDTTGHFDAAIIAKFKTRRQMDDFLKLVQSYDFVERTETRLILNIIKESNIVV